MKNTNTKIIILIIVVVIIVAGIWYWQKPTPATGEPIKIGFIGALTGVGAAIGQEEYNGARLAVEEINKEGGVLGRPLELVPEDVSLDKMRVAGSVTQKLIEVDKVIAIVGPQWDEPAFAILPIIEESKVPMVGADNTDDLESDTNYDYFFSTWYDNRVGIDKLLQFSKENNYKKIAVIKPLAGGFWQFTATDFIKKASQYDISIVSDIDLGNPLITDFRTPLSKVKILEPDAIFMVVSDNNQCTLLKQMKELGLNVPLLSTEAAGNSVVVKQCPELLGNLFFSSPVSNSRDYDEFIKSFVNSYSRKPEFPSAVTSYDAVKVIASGLEKTKGTGGELLQNAISDLVVSGASVEKIEFNEKGFAITSPEVFKMFTFKNGEFVTIE